uniref:Uncharacterized protein n=1 Tax=Rhinopithecus bieti TaxID=61621 RepID=A0A2K6KRJ2_RHIBE
MTLWKDFVETFGVKLTRIERSHSLSGMRWFTSSVVALCARITCFFRVLRLENVPLLGNPCTVSDSAGCLLQFPK